MIVRASVVLPHPDSPARASISPRSSVRSTPSTARDRSAFLPAMPAPSPTRPSNDTCRPRTSRTGPSDAGARSGAVLTSGPVRASGRADRRPGVPRRPGTDRARSLEHSSNATGHRGWNEHPTGTASGCGGSPPRPDGARRNRGSPIAGNAAASASVYGWAGVANTGCDGPCSTIRPAYMIASRSQTSTRTDRSWVMNSIARPSSC